MGMERPRPVNEGFAAGASSVFRLCSRFLGMGREMSFVHWERDVEGAGPGGVASTDGSRVRGYSDVEADSDVCDLWEEERNDREE